MREIKFRAWDEEKKRMLYSNESYDYGNVEFGFIDGELCVIRYRCGWNNHAIPNKLESVKNIMQYTGLKDRNGREIYEGDIVECGIANIRSIVTFEKGAFRPVNMFDDTQTSVKVIGNIYKNPELLEVENG
jgi:uncharacterized phage protein (TIGR01671 family)